MITRVLSIGGNDVSVNQSGELRKHIEYYGKSTDDKPTNAKNADTFYEMDTKKAYIFDEESKEWVDV